MSEHLSPDALELWAKGSADSAEERHHLDICLECAQTLKEAKDYFAVLSGLRPRKAPPGFALRLRARMDAPSGWGKLGTALFLPLRFKLPLQLAGVALIVLLFLVLPARFGKPVPMELAAHSPEPASPSVPEKPAPAPLPMSSRRPAAEELAMADRKEPIRALAATEPEKPKSSFRGEFDSEAGRPAAAVEEEGYTARGGAAAPHIAARKKAESKPAETEYTPVPAEHELSAAIPAEPARVAGEAATPGKRATAPAAPAPAPSIVLSYKQDSLIRASGFRLEVHGGEAYYELKTSKVAGDSLAVRLMSLGLGERTSVVIPSGSPDSVVIKVR